MNPDRVLDSFLEMIPIESPSFHEAPMAAYCSSVLEDMGFTVEFDESASATGSDVGNLIARLPGTTPAHIAFSAHMDTVKPCAGIEAVVVRESVIGADGTAEEIEVVRSAGDTILSADDKAGLAAIFEGIRRALEENAPRPDITVLITTCEEQSLLGSSALAPDVLEGDVPCFVLDADGAPGTLVMGAPYHYTLRATVTGRAAHAGVEPEEGVSALQIAAAAIAAMPLGRIDEVTTANMGVIEGGVAVNIVPAEVRLMGECRSLYEDRVNVQRDAMTRAIEEAARRFGGGAEIHWTVDYPAVVHEPGDAIVEHLVRAARACGLEPRFSRSGGGADANVLGTKGADAITLGIGMTNFHSVDEFIAVRDLSAMAAFVRAIIDEYAA